MQDALITTALELPGYRIVKSLGVVRGLTVRSRSIVGNIAGVGAPFVTGLVVDHTHGFYWAFVIAAFVTLLGCLAFGVLIPRIEPIKWTTT